VSVPLDGGGDFTPAALFLLSKFRGGRDTSAFIQDYWTEALGEKASTTINRLVRAGMLTPATVRTKLAVSCTVPMLKGLLKERGLSTTGRKEQCIDRLVVNDPAGIAARVASLSVFECTTGGRAAVESFVAARSEQSRVAKERCMQLLNEGDLDGAVEASRSGPASIFDNANAIELSTTKEIEFLKLILGKPPRLLKDLSPENMRYVQIAAAMGHLWGSRNGEKWLPDTVTGSGVLDRETTVRMVLFFAKSRWDLARWKEIDIRKVEVSVVGDAISCPQCQEIAGKVFCVNQVPEIPYEKCTSEMGCRCMLRPIMSWESAYRRVHESQKSKP
jgi:hypothetical protein